MADNCKKCGYEVKPRCGCFDADGLTQNEAFRSVTEGMGYSTESWYAEDARKCHCCGLEWLTSIDGADCPKCEPNCHNKPDTSLSLLIIDLSTHCVVKVERGEMSAMFAVEERGYHFTELDSIKCLPHPFAAVRDAIDSQDKPLPRIERTEIGGNERYQLYFNETSYPLPANPYDALSELAGKPLPIWTGGQWEQFPVATRDTMNDTGISVWRYRR